VSNKRDSSLERLPGLALLLALLTAAGLLVATLAVPLVLGTGLAAKSTADSFEALPTGLPDPVLGVDSRILAADGSVLAVLHGPQNRVPVRIEQVAPVRSAATTAPHPARPDQTRPFPGAELPDAPAEHAALAAGTVGAGPVMHVGFTTMSAATPPRPHDGHHPRCRDLRVATPLIWQLPGPPTSRRTGAGSALLRLLPCRCDAPFPPP